MGSGGGPLAPVAGVSHMSHSRPKAGVAQRIVPWILQGAGAGGQEAGAPPLMSLDSGVEYFVW